MVKCSNRNAAVKIDSTICCLHTNVSKNTLVLVVCGAHVSNNNNSSTDSYSAYNTYVECSTCKWKPNQLYTKLSYFAKTHIIEVRKIHIDFSFLSKVYSTKLHSLNNNCHEIPHIRLKYFNLFFMLLLL